MDTLYEVLGVAHDVSHKDLKSAYHAKLLQTHPDKAKQEVSGTSVSQLQSAYAVLGNPESRQAYDEELKVSFKKQGFNITGAGLDVYTLSDFSETHDQEADAYSWSRDCPRCTAPNGMVLTEMDLERGTPDGTGFSIVVSCQTCSLWITVLYEEL